jgi:quercetin dioxygenase-like cupin family protein
LYHQAINTEVAEKLPLSREAWKMFSFDNHEVIRLDMEPGDSMENHSNDQRVIIYVLEGMGILNIDGTEHPLKAHQAIAVEPGVDRYLNNTGDITLKLLVNKTPKAE